MLVVRGAARQPLQREASAARTHRCRWGMKGRRAHHTCGSRQLVTVTPLTSELTNSLSVVVARAREWARTAS